ncbi:HAD family phosphatase [Pseudoflavitalea sp. G-6-1-2]|uniref:HAD family hydrolase n=1 Tax=Pseudoflavitalea sp. G-6-1-2 TaxID=2728841 RepID=UPI00146F0B85|nr:HAD family phosphatase [Pseudoflavitalea sp. G-6-1-2]NML20135.1 HAD family phosphatase [Pseudoflavitalea sp. G-6-1-2]
MQPIKNIIFDLGGVLLNLDIPKTTAAFEHLGAPEFKNLFGLGRAESFLKAYEVGTINDDEFVSDLQKLTGGKSRESVVEAWNAMLLDFPKERFELLQQLKERYRIYLFSNTNAIHLTAFSKTFSDTFNGASLDDEFTKAWYSHLIRMRKPDVAAYEYILKDAQLNAGETVFIDDALVNIEGARKAGLHGIHLEPGKTILDINWNLS